MQVDVKYEGKRGGITFKEDLKYVSIFVDGTNLRLNVIADSESNGVEVINNVTGEVLGLWLIDKTQQ